MLAKAALMLNAKAILVSHNEAHSATLVKILEKFVKDDIEANKSSSKYAPQDFQERLDALQPDRLKKFLAQRKRPQDSEMDAPANKRIALAASVDTLLDSMMGITPKAKVEPKPAASPKAKAEPATKAGSPAVQESAAPGPSGSNEALVANATAGASGASPAPAPAEPAEDLAKLLQQWGK